MKMHYLGDSYDLAKQSLLRWLRPFGEWSVHPMFTEPCSPVELVRLETFLDATVISRRILSPTTNRKRYFASAVRRNHLFLDPNTGVRLQHRRLKNAPHYL